MAADMAADVAALLWPPRCHCCGEEPGPESPYLCGVCLAALPRTGYGMGYMNPVEQRLAGRVAFSHATAWCMYSHGGRLSPLVQDFKYRGYRSLARHMGELAAADPALDSFFADADMLLPVPIHFLRRMRRGYNQSREIALGIGGRRGIRVGSGLRAVRPHVSQTGLSAERRRRNPGGSFRYRPGEDEAALRRIVIVDDICTTGATLVEAAKAVAERVPDAEIRLFALAATT